MTIQLLVIGNHDDTEVWTSVQNLKKSFWEYWSRYESVAQVHYYDYIDFPFDNKLIKIGLSSQALIFYRATSYTSRFIRTIRKLDGDNRRKVILYTEESPSIAFSNYKLLNLEDSLYAKDILVAHNKRDVSLIQRCCNAEATCLPATLNHLLQNPEVKLKREYSNLCYVGRISGQKNIHSILLSLSLIHEKLRRAGVKLFIYGREDGYGSPNMGKPDSAYEKHLQDLCRILQVDDLVEFRGFFLSTEEMWKEIDQLQCLNISLSLHADEDYGFSIAEGINNGIHSILTDWGGYGEFIENFPDATIPVKVYKSVAGPYVNPFEVASLIESNLSFANEQTCKIPTRFKRPEQLDIKEITYSGDNTPFKFKEFAKGVHQQVVPPQDLSQNLQRYCQYGVIFSDYSDNLANEVFQEYGAVHKMFMPEGNERKYIPPWFFQVSEKKYIVKDPHRGNFNFLLQRGEVACHIMGSNSSVFLDLNSVHKLNEYGFIYK